MWHTYWDAICFVPNRDILFKGFGLFSNFDRKNTKVKIQWVIGNSFSETYEVELLSQESDEQNNWHTIDIRNLGVEAIKVEEGVEIHVKAMPSDSN